jgi:hypothetical protein
VGPGGAQWTCRSPGRQWKASVGQTALQDDFTIAVMVDGKQDRARISTVMTSQKEKMLAGETYDATDPLAEESACAPAAPPTKLWKYGGRMLTGLSSPSCYLTPPISDRAALLLRLRLQHLCR